MLGLLMTRVKMNVKDVLSGSKVAKKAAAAE